MKFNCFPKRQDRFLIYSSYVTFRSIQFQNLTIQSSPKNSVFYRFLKGNIGFIVSSVLKYNLPVPNEGSDYVGIIKSQKIILFEMKNNQPVAVWKKDNNEQWIKESFLGYQLIAEYTTNEFEAKYGLIKRTLKIHWNTLLKTPNKIHGDFTHFNILFDKKEKIHFIDDKNHKNSILFDFFYFYAYLKQSLCKCSTLSYVEKRKITSHIEAIIRDVCQYQSEDKFIYDIKQIVIPEKCGLQVENKTIYLKDFINIFKGKLSLNRDYFSMDK